MKYAFKSSIIFSLIVTFCLNINTLAAHYATDNENPVMTKTVFGGAYLQFANKMGGEISSEAIAAQRELGVSGCAAGSRIFQFTLYITKDGKRSSFASKSHVLSKEMIKKLSSLGVGDEFEFKKIKAYLPKKEGIVDVHSNKFIVV